MRGARPPHRAAGTVIAALQSKSASRGRSAHMSVMSSRSGPHRKLLSPHLRCGSRRVAEGDEVGHVVRPMIAKRIARRATATKGSDRLAQHSRAEVAGVTTNLPFLLWLVAHPALACRRDNDGLPLEHPPLSAPPAALPRSGPGAGGSGSPCRRPHRSRRPTRPAAHRTAPSRAPARIPPPMPAVIKVMS